ncbi:MAG: nucleotide exchange factor GrpE [Pseudomonadota bacterium]|nr:nucleotide exchange factor GrpE [Pseudomonadota bacterium]
MVKKTTRDMGGLRDAPEGPLAGTGLETPETTPEDPRVRSVDRELEEARRECAENYDKYLRAVADLDNYRKRAAKEKAEAIKYGNESLIRELLPLADSLDRALRHADESDDFESFKKGLGMLKDQLLCCLGKHGVEPIDCVCRPFDPNYHEAFMQVTSREHEDNQVVEELEKGYLLNGRLLRPARVTVCKRPDDDGTC